MAAVLKDSGIVGRIEAILVNRTPDVSIATEMSGDSMLTYGGLDGDNHYGVTRASCVRFKDQYPEGAEVRNTRQISIVSVEDLAEIAKRIGVPELKPEWLGANLLVSGIPSFTLIPPNTRLLLPSGGGIAIDLENKPCQYPAQLINEVYPGKGTRFPSKGNYLRGVTGWVEREGAIAVGDAIQVHIPAQPAWPSLLQDQVAAE